jgi:hypothetical protein
MRSRSPRLFDNGVSFGPVAFELLAIERACAFQRYCEAADRIAKLPACEVILALHSYVLVLAVADVTAPPVSDELEETWAFTRSNSIDGFLRHRANGGEIVPVGSRPLDSMRFRIATD